MKSKVSLWVALFLSFEVSLYYSLKLYVDKTSKELVNIWFKAEEVNIKSGNLLTSISKHQRIIINSDVVKSVYLVKRGEQDVVMASYGASVPENKIIRSIESENEASRASLFEFVYKKKIKSNKENFLLLYFIKPIFIQNMFLLISSLVFVLMTIIIYVNSQKEKLLTFLREEEKKGRESLKEVALQVTHDIKSPLAALKMGVNELSCYNEDLELLTLLNSSLGRVESIVDDLCPTDQKNKMEAICLKTCLLRIIEEKNKENLNYKAIKFNLNLDNTYYVKVIEAEFKRCLSNIINNAIESSVNPIISISAQNSKEKSSAVKVSISDNGKGIDPVSLEKVFKRGYTLGKKGGIGVGLSYTKEKIESFGGDIKIFSKEREGTTVIFNLVETNKPEWLITELDLRGQSLVLVDNDTSIHSMWKRTLKGFDNEVIFFKSIKSFEKWRKEKSSVERYTVIVDYEFNKDEINGLDLIKKSHLSKAYLSTSHSENEEIRNRTMNCCEGLIPKNLVDQLLIFGDKLYSGYANPLFLQSEEKAVLVENDMYIAHMWKRAAERKGIEISIYKSACELKDAASQINKATPIYIDSSLGEGERGEDLAVDLNELGFQNLYMQTGYSSDQFQNLEFLKGVVGKQAPWS